MSTMNSTTITAGMRQKAERLATVIPLCSRGSSKRNGQEFVLIPSESKPGTSHLSTATGCTCEGFRRRGRAVCTHSIAVALVEERAATAPAGVLTGKGNAVRYAYRFVNALRDLSASDRADVLGMLAVEIREMPVTG